MRGGTLAQAMEQVQALLPTPARSDSGPPPKIPKVSQLVVVRGPRPQLPVRANDDHCHRFIHKMCDEAGYMWEDAKGIAEPLWQVAFLRAL